MPIMAVRYRVKLVIVINYFTTYMQSHYQNYNFVRATVTVREVSDEATLARQGKYWKSAPILSIIRQPTTTLTECVDPSEPFG